jgi:hypothetical protein
MKEHLPATLGLFQKRIDGDDALLELAQLRFNEVKMSAEVYADSPEELSWILGFRPLPEGKVVVHLSRAINLFEETGKQQFLSFASSFKNQVYGFVLHDSKEIKERFHDYIVTLQDINSSLMLLDKAPYLFIEYSGGLEPHYFCEIFHTIQNLGQVSACIDIGHVGIWRVRENFFTKHPGVDICSFSPSHSDLHRVIDDIEESAHNNLVHTVLTIIQDLGSLNKPLHFHLHDGHPLSPFSPFGVSDHLSFYEEIPIPFTYNGKNSLSTMYQPTGLKKIIAQSLTALTPDKLSFTLEIHPKFERMSLNGYSYLFNHWVDKTHAEQMNHWLSVLVQNHHLLIDACKK